MNVTKKEIKRLIKDLKTFNKALDISYKEELTNELKNMVLCLIKRLNFLINEKYGLNRTVKSYYEKIEEQKNSRILYLYVDLYIETIKDIYKL